MQGDITQDSFFKDMISKQNVMQKQILRHKDDV